jgi:hypothetical protein
MTTLKSLLVATALVAAIVPAKAAGIRYYNDDGSTNGGTFPVLGYVDFEPYQPVACRNLDDAIEAAGKFNDHATDGWRDLRAKIDFVRLHQAGSKRGVGPYNEPVRIKPKNDCVVATGASEGRDETAPLHMPVEIRMKAPRLPVGMIAICVAAGSMVKDACDEPTSDKRYEGYVSYWIVTRPESIKRNFDLLKGD